MPSTSSLAFSKAGAGRPQKKPVAVLAPLPTWTRTVAPAGIVAHAGKVKRRRCESRTHQPPIDASSTGSRLWTRSHSPLTFSASSPSASHRTLSQSAAGRPGPGPHASVSQMPRPPRAAAWAGGP